MTLDFKLLRRYREIISILLKYGFQDILAESGVSLRARILEKLVPDSMIQEANRFSKWEKMRLAAEELGTTFIKFAQVLSNRPDVIPAELVAEFEKLQAHVPPFSSDDAVRIIEEETGKTISELFLEFEKEPFAAASIAQVHKGRLKDGTQVVMKVRRPDIIEKIELDIIILRYFARKLVERGIYEELDPVGMVRAFDNAIHKELDLSHEGLNLQRFANNFKDSSEVFVPRYFPKLTTAKLLTMEFVRGIHPYDREGLAHYQLDSRVLARRGLRALFDQIFKHGFFHADPHPGNLFALPGNKVCFIDFGMMGTVLKTDVEFFADIVYGVTGKDASRLIWGIKNIALSQQFEGLKTFEYEVEELIQDYHAQAADKANMADLFNRLLGLVHKYKIRMPADYFLLSKSLVTIEGVGRRLDPEMSIIAELTPHINQTLADEMNPLEILKRLAAGARDTFALLEALPRDLREIISKIKKGEVKVTVDHEGLGDLTKRIEFTGSLIAKGFLSGSVLLSASMLIAVRFPPLYKHYSIPGTVLLALAAILLINTLIQAGKKKGA